MQNRNYMMSATDVAAELGVSKGHAYKLLRQLNEELKAAGYITVSGKVPRAYWEKKFYGYTQIAG
jgi:transposase